MHSLSDIVTRAIVVTTALTLILAFSPFHKECQPLSKRLIWFYIRYVLPAYLIILASEYLFGVGR